MKLHEANITIFSNTDRASDKDMKYVSQQISSAQHHLNILDERYSSLLWENPKDVFFQRFPADDIADIIPSEVFKDYKAFEGITGIGSTKLFIRKTRKDLIGAFKKLIRNIDRIQKRKTKLVNQFAKMRGKWKKVVPNT